jgi:hypothetical protein
MALMAVVVAAVVGVTVSSGRQPYSGGWSLQNRWTVDYRPMLLVFRSSFWLKLGQQLYLLGYILAPLASLSVYLLRRMAPPA